MSREVLYGHDFTQDVLNQSRWYGRQRDAGLAEGYKSAITATIRLLNQHPGLGAHCHFPDPALVAWRSIPVDRPFHQHLLFYFVIGEKLVIFRVLSGARNLRERLLEPPEQEED